MSNSLYLIWETTIGKWSILNKTYPNRTKVQFPFPVFILNAERLHPEASWWHSIVALIYPGACSPLLSTHWKSWTERVFYMYCKKEGYTFNQRFVLRFSFTGHFSFTIFGFQIIGRHCKNLRTWRNQHAIASAFEAVIGSVKRWITAHESRETSYFAPYNKVDLVHAVSRITCYRGK